MRPEIDIDEQRREQQLRLAQRVRHARYAAPSLAPLLQSELLSRRWPFPGQLGLDLEVVAAHGAVDIGVASCPVHGHVPFSDHYPWNRVEPAHDPVRDPRALALSH